MKRRSVLIYGTLLAIWVLLLAWQVVEHNRVEASARIALGNRAKDISNTLGLLMRSQRFFGVISKERLEYALNALVSHGELQSVELLNAMEEVVASAGPPIELPPKTEIRGGEHWDKDTVTLLNLVDLGTNVTHDLEITNLSIIMPSRELFRAFQTNRPPPRPEPGPGEFNPPHDTNTPAPQPNPQPNFAPPPNFDGPRRRPDFDSDMGTNAPPRRHGWRGGITNELRAFARPAWMKEDEYQSIIQKKGVHSFILVMSSKSLKPILDDDLRVRAIIVILGTISVLGMGLAWRTLAKTSELQIRLVRASEQNLHLQQMNLAAAGLAHETRNPLNIVRGLAQLISKENNASTEIRDKSRSIIDETDRITAQLNEFINYSRPRQVRRTAINAASVTGEVARALGYDIEEKKICIQLQTDPLLIEADEQLLRQALFNLVLNAIQAVRTGGTIQIKTSKINNAEAAIKISDNGPGVSPEHLTEIFKPYFTTNQNGTGLGLAIVQQIILAHGWEITCQPNHPRGATFVINHIKLAAAKS